MLSASAVASGGSAMTTALTGLGDLPALPLDALADLAAAAGYEDRGDRAAAELYLGFGLAKIGHGVVAPAAVAGLLRLVYTLARGTALRNGGNRI